MNSRLLNEAHARLLAAEVEFLRSCGLVPLVPPHPDAPIVWRDSLGRKVQQDQAVAELKARWVALTQRSR